MHLWVGLSIPDRQRICEDLYVRDSSYACSAARRCGRLDSGQLRSSTCVIRCSRKGRCVGGQAGWRLVSFRPGPVVPGSFVPCPVRPLIVRILTQCTCTHPSIHPCHSSRFAPVGNHHWSVLLRRGILSLCDLLVHSSSISVSFLFLFLCLLSLFLSMPCRRLSSFFLCLFLSVLSVLSSVLFLSSTLWYPSSFLFLFHILSVHLCPSVSGHHLITEQLQSA